MTALEAAFAIVALFGHAALWIGVYNRLHALALPCWIVGLCEKAIYLALIAAPAAWLGAVLFSDFSFRRPVNLPALGPLWAYAAVCWIVALGPGLLWLVRPTRPNPRQVLLSNHSRHCDLAAELDEPLLIGAKTNFLGRIPGNQILKLEINEKVLCLPDLPEALDGLTIVHVSDLHFAGRIARPYFDYVIDEANRLDGDLVAVTGDVVDKPACLGWIPETLGRLRSRYGVYGVLGNHDKRIRNVEQLRHILGKSGVTMLGGRWVDIAVRGARVVLAGDERPWFGSAPDLTECPPAADAFRILLAHTPDQVVWAQEHNFALVLAGHNHGGQIRFPLLGPIVSPSRYGVRYAGGVYREGSTVLHVSRGAGALHPLRFNCPPELTKLVLTRGG